MPESMLWQRVQESKDARKKLDAELRAWLTERVPPELHFWWKREGDSVFHELAYGTGHWFFIEEKDVRQEFFGKEFEEAVAAFRKLAENWRENVSFNPIEEEWRRFEGKIMLMSGIAHVAFGLKKQGG